MSNNYRCINGIPDKKIRQALWQWYSWRETLALNPPSTRTKRIEVQFNLLVRANKKRLADPLFAHHLLQLIWCGHYCNAPQLLEWIKQDYGVQNSLDLPHAAL